MTLYDFQQSLGKSSVLIKTMTRSTWMLATVLLVGCIDAPHQHRLAGAAGATGTSTNLRQIESAGEPSWIDDDQAGAGGEAGSSDEPLDVGGSGGSGGLASGSGGTGGDVEAGGTLAGAGGTITSAGGHSSGGSASSHGGSPSVGGAGGVGGSAGQGGSVGGSGGTMPVVPGTDGLIYGYGGGNYLGTMRIECQYTVPGVWKYGDPIFTVKHPVTGEIMGKDIPCGGEVRNLSLSIEYLVFGNEGTTPWYSGGFHPGHVVIIKMP